MGWGKETWAWWPLSVAMINPRWRLLMHSALCQCDLLEPSVVVVKRYTKHSLYSLRVLLSPLSRCEDTLGVIPPPNSHWTGYVYADCSPSLTLRWSCLKKRERWGWKCFPISERLYGKVQKRSTTCPTWFHCQSFHWPLIPIENRAPRQREDWAFTQLSSFYKMPMKPELSWNVSWSRKHRSWLEGMMIGGSNRLGGMRGDEHGWSSKQMPLFKRYFPRQTQPTALVNFFCNSPLLHEWNAGHHHATGQGCPSYHLCTSGCKGSPSPGPSSSPTHPPGTPPLPVVPLPDIPFVGTPLVRYPFAEFLAIHTWKKWDCSPSSSLRDHCDKRTHVNSQEVEARSEHSSAQGDEDTPKLVTEAGPSFNQQQGQEPTSPPLVQPGPPLILMMVLQQEVWRVPVIRPHLTQTCPGRMWLTLIWTQLLGTASLAWTQMKWPYELPGRSTGSRYEFPVGSAKAVCGLRLNWNDWQQPAGCVGIWPWECSSGVGLWSCGRLQLLCNV